jgi:hypothetical protein
MSECAICLEKYHEPIVLPCGHSFDRHCLLQVNRQECPICRRKFNDPIESLPLNFALFHCVCDLGMKSSSRESLTKIIDFLMQEIERQKSKKMNFYRLSPKSIKPIVPESCDFIVMNQIACILIEFGFHVKIEYSFCVPIMTKSAIKSLKIFW